MTVALNAMVLARSTGISESSISPAMRALYSSLDAGMKSSAHVKHRSNRESRSNM